MSRDFRLCPCTVGTLAAVPAAYFTFFLAGGGSREGSRELQRVGEEGFDGQDGQDGQEKLEGEWLAHSSDRGGRGQLEVVVEEGFSSHCTRRYSKDCE